MDFHKIDINGIEGHPEAATVKIDGVEVCARAYSIVHEAQKLPLMNINLIAVPTLSMNGKVRVSNKEELAKCFDQEEFDEFCKIWRETQDNLVGVDHVNEEDVE